MRLKCAIIHRSSARVKHVETKPRHQNTRMDYSKKIVKLTFFFLKTTLANRISNLKPRKVVSINMGKRQLKPLD